MKLKLASLCLLLCLAGCNKPPEKPQQQIQEQSQAQEQIETRDYYTPPPRQTHYDLEMSNEQISSTYTAHWQERQQEKSKLALLAVEQDSIAAIASNIKTCYAKGLPEMASALIQSHPRIYTWDEVQDIVDISYVYRPYGGLRGSDLQIKIAPTQPLADSIVVCFPPGLYGKTLGTRKVQDLGIIEAPVIQVKDTTTTGVNIACLTYATRAPRTRTPYELHKTPADTGVYRLLVEICAGKFQSPDVQLALWIVGNELSWDKFYHGISTITFDSRSVTIRNSEGAANLIIKAGMDPNTSPYFGGEGQPERLTPPAIIEDDPEPAKPEKESPKSDDISS